jgi:alpha-L-fucosidase 2
MKIIKGLSILSLLLLFNTLGYCQKKNSVFNSNKLWYNQPASATAVDVENGWQNDPEWLKALPLGNGSLGAMVFGDVNKERIQLNEESMWSGSPDDNDNPNAYPAQKEIRDLLFQGKYIEANKLTAQTQICKGQGSGHGNGATVPFGCFQTLGDLWIDFENQEEYQDYRRELDMDDAMARVSYTQNGVTYLREIFISEPDQIMVIKITANKPGKISFRSTMTRPEKYVTTAERNQLTMKGVLSDGKGGEGLKYMTRLKALHKNGKISYTNSELIVENADEVTLLLTASTDYILDYPSYKGRDYENITLKNLEKGSDKNYSELRKRHLEEYQKYFSRVDFRLSPLAVDAIPTDVRLETFKDEMSDPKLVELLFQYGRYLLISSSRPGSLPANLQGIWANKIQTPWNGDYHTDINVQMNYWLAESTNLPEMHLPLFDLTASLQKPGAKTAKVYYNAEGWVIHPITNIWGYTSPGESF